MNIFLSYASPSRPHAEELCARLQAAGHEVFFDREDLPPGVSFDDRIREAIEACELFIFLVTPDSVGDKHYTRTELKIVAQKWPTPGMHVLPVLLEPTPFETIPAYLRAINLLQPEGNLPAEVLLVLRQREAQRSAAPPKDPDGLRYTPISLRFARDGDGYSVTWAGGPGASAQRCLLSLAPEALGASLWEGAVPVEGEARRGSAAATSLLPSGPSARKVGEALHRALFGSALGPSLAARMRQVSAQRGEGVRLSLDTTEAPELARLPWEFLYDAKREDYVFSDQLRPVVRALSVDTPVGTLEVTPPLRLLIAVAAPSDRPTLDVAEELMQLDHSLGELVEDGMLIAERLEHASVDGLDEALLRFRPHVLHFVGHGDFDGDEGHLVLESDEPPGRAAPISGRRLGVLLRNHLGSLRLVFLNSCMGAASSGSDAFSGVAQSLIRRGLPAVVAMQFPVPDQDAVPLAQAFYRYLAAGLPVDGALTSARAFMLARGEGTAWGAPILFLATPDGALFQLGVREEAQLSVAAPTRQLAAPSRQEAPPPQPRRRTAGLLAGAGLVLLLLAVFAGSRLMSVGDEGMEGRGDIDRPAPTSPDVGPDEDPTFAPIETDPPPDSVEEALPPPDPPDGAEILELRVRRGDSLSSLARRLLGDGAAWPELQRRHNALAPDAERIEDPDRLAIGQRVFFAPSDGAPAEYHVARGESLWRIAARLYGDGQEWPRLQALNHLPNPDLLLPGQVLLLPSPAAASEPE